MRSTALKKKSAVGNQRAKHALPVFAPGSKECGNGVLGVLWKIGVVDAATLNNEGGGFASHILTGIRSWHQEPGRIFSAGNI